MNERDILVNSSFIDSISHYFNGDKCENLDSCLKNLDVLLEERGNEVLMHINESHVCDLISCFLEYRYEFILDILLKITFLTNRFSKVFKNRDIIRSFSEQFDNFDIKNKKMVLKLLRNVIIDCPSVIDILYEEFFFCKILDLEFSSSLLEFLLSSLRYECADDNCVSLIMDNLCRRDLLINNNKYFSKCVMTFKECFKNDESGLIAKKILDYGVINKLIPFVKNTDVKEMTLNKLELLYLMLDATSNESLYHNSILTILKVNKIDELIIPYISVDFDRDICLESFRFLINTCYMCEEFRESISKKKYMETIDIKSIFFHGDYLMKECCLSFLYLFFDYFTDNYLMEIFDDTFCDDLFSLCEVDVKKYHSYRLILIVLVKKVDTSIYKRFVQLCHKFSLLDLTSSDKINADDNDVRSLAEVLENVLTTLS